MIATARIELAARRALDDRSSARRALAWYLDARSYCESVAAGFDVTPRAVMGAIAALSPMQSWKTQLEYTPRVVSAAISGEPIPGPGFTKNKETARAILRGSEVYELLTGPKVSAFFVCIISAGQTDRVCIDRHAHAIAAGPDCPKMTAKRYRECVAAYISTAAALRASFPELGPDLTPANLQALVWVWWRQNPANRY